MLIPHRRQLQRPGGACLRDELVRVVDHQQHSAGSAPIRTRTRALRGRTRDPITGLPHGQLGDHIVAVADEVQHGRAKRSLVEGDRLARTLDPEFRLDARHAELPLARSSGRVPSRYEDQGAAHAVMGP
jgi:hypothetical protein